MKDEMIFWMLFSEKDLDAAENATPEERSKLGITQEVIAEIRRRLEEAERRREEERRVAERRREAEEKRRAEEEAKRQEEAKRREEEDKRFEKERQWAGETKTITLPGGATMELVWCPPGRFMMGGWQSQGSNGWDYFETQHEVTLTKGFWLAKHPVTQAQWKSIMGNNPSCFKGDDLPVESVTWNECQEFCKKAGLRLPTEAEWEYACRAGTQTDYSWGDTLNGDKANCDGRYPYPYGWTKEGPCLHKTTRVGSYPANAWGLHDMHGNVLEWCADWYRENLGSVAVTDPTGPGPASRSYPPYRVLRGGYFGSRAKHCRSAWRDYGDPASRFKGWGFRPCSSAGLH